MLAVLAITGPIYIVLALGFLATRHGVFEKSELRVFGKFVVNFSLPALLFNALSQRDFAEILNPHFLAAYAFGSLGAIAAGVFWARRFARKDLTQAAYVGMGMGCPNSGFVGYPLVLQLLGPVAAVGLALVMIIENVLSIPAVMALADAGASRERGHWRAVLAQSLKGLVRNPMIIGIAAGFIFSMAGWKLPVPLAKAVEVLALASAPLGLFVMGGSLSGLSVHGLWRDVSAIAFGKLLLHPLLTLLAVLLLPPFDPALRTAVVLFAAAPMLGIYTIMAQRHGHEDMAAAAQLGTTILSFFTLTSLMWALQR